MRALREMSDLDAKLKYQVEQERSLGSLRLARLCFEGAVGMLEGGALSSVLLAHVISGEPAETVLGRFRAFADKGTSGGAWYAALAGITVSEAYELGSGFELVPWADVPDCPQRSRLSGENHSLENFAGLRPKPNCALRFSLPERRVLFQPNEPELQTAPSDLSDVYPRAQDALRSMTAVTARAVAILGSWPYATEDALRQLTPTVFAYEVALNDVAIFATSLEPATLDVPLTAKHFNSISTLNDANAKAAMRIALDRVIFALHQRTQVDKAIDLGIALEVMLLHDFDTNERGELRYRSAVRGAHFLGGSRSERLDNFKRLKDVYDLRSKAVHSGRLPDKPKVAETLESSVELCVRIARKILELGRFPRWEEEYIF